MLFGLTWQGALVIYLSMLGGSYWSGISRDLGTQKRRWDTKHLPLPISYRPISWTHTPTNWKPKHDGAANTGPKTPDAGPKKGPNRAPGPLANPPIDLKRVVKTWFSPSFGGWVWSPSVDASEIRRENHLGCIKKEKLANNGINYQPQLMQDFFHQQYHMGFGDLGFVLYL